MRYFCRLKFAAFGCRSELRPGVYVDAPSKIYIGSDVVVRPGSFLFADPRPEGGKIHIEDKVLLGPSVHVYTNDHMFGATTASVFDQGYPDPSDNQSVYLRSGCWVGAGVIILRGVEIGQNSVVAAGSVVTKNVPACVLVAGVPARVIRRFQ